MRYLYVCPKCQTETIINKEAKDCSNGEYCHSCGEQMQRVYDDFIEKVGE